MQEKEAPLLAAIAQELLSLAIMTGEQFPNPQTLRHHPAKEHTWGRFSLMMFFHNKEFIFPRRAAHLKTS